MCAVRICCAVGPAPGPEGAAPESDEKLEAEGEAGVGRCVESSLRYDLHEAGQNTCRRILSLLQETCMVSFARGGLLLFVLLPSASNGWPGMMISPTVAHIFSCIMPS